MSWSLMEVKGLMCFQGRLTKCKDKQAGNEYQDKY